MAESPAKRSRTIDARETIDAHETRGLLSEIIHSILGDPIRPHDPTTALITAKKGQPEWARQFSNLHGVIDDTGIKIIPEDEYQAARFDDSFRTLLNWFHALDDDEQARQLARIRQKGTSTEYWRGVDGIFAKILKGVLSRSGDRVNPVIAQWCSLQNPPIQIPRLLHPSPTPQELETIMKNAITKKLQSRQFKEFIHDHLVRDHLGQKKLPFWIAEDMSRGSHNKWTITPHFNRAYKYK